MQFKFYFKKWSLSWFEGAQVGVGDEKDSVFPTTLFQTLPSGTITMDKLALSLAYQSFTVKFQ